MPRRALGVLWLAVERQVVVERGRRGGIEVILVGMGDQEGVRAGDDVLPPRRQLDEGIRALIGCVGYRWPGSGRIQHGIDQEPFATIFEQGGSVAKQGVTHGLILPGITSTQLPKYRKMERTSPLAIHRIRAT